VRRPKKVPRVSLEKYLRGGAAGRRAAVATFGDSLRELGVVRVEGWGSGSGQEEAEELRELVRLLLAALEEYFGLADGAMAGHLGEPMAPPEEGAGAGAHLMAVWQGSQARMLEAVLPGDVGLPVGARDGELVVFAGPALATLTNGLVPEGHWRVGGGRNGDLEAERGALRPLLVAPDPTRPLAPLPELAGA
jgi:hypothetical protein